MNETMGHKMVQIPVNGTNICMKGIWYQILSTVTYQDEPGVFVTHATLLELSGEGEDAGKDTISVNLDMHDYIL